MIDMLKKSNTLIGFGAGVLIGAVFASTFKVLAFLAIAGGVGCLVVGALKKKEAVE